MPRIVTMLLALALVALGCSSDDARTGIDPEIEEDGEMTEGEEAVRRQAMATLDTSTEFLDLLGPTALGRSGCSLYAAWDLQSTDPYPVEYVVMPDGSVVEGLTEGAAGRALDGCFFDAGVEPTAGDVAEVMVRFADAPGPVGLLDEAAGPARLEPLGLEYQPPTASGTLADGAFTVTYFASNLESGRVLRATVTRTADGAIESAYERL